MSSERNNIEFQKVVELHSSGNICFKESNGVSEMTVGEIIAQSPHEI